MDVSNEPWCRFGMQTLTHLQPTSLATPTTCKSKVAIPLRFSTNLMFDNHSLMFASVQIDDGNEVTASANTAISVRIVISHSYIPPLLILVLQIGQETTLVASGGSGAVIFTVSVPQATFIISTRTQGVQAPTTGDTGELVALNETGQPQGIAVGTLRFLITAAFVSMTFVTARLPRQCRCPQSFASLAERRVCVLCLVRVDDI